jgi:hypothetical protein
VHHRAKDITGQKCGFLTATRYVGSDGKKSLWEFHCAGCNGSCQMPARDFRKQQKNATISSCGCQRRNSQSLRRTTHGHSRSPQYAVYRSMLARCQNPTHQAYQNYGGRGVTVCARWAESFDNFWEDMAAGYQAKMSLDRIDNNAGYFKENCR